MGKFLITLFLGWAGIHKFMDKKTGVGILYLFTFGLFGLGWIYDIIKTAIPLFKKPETKSYEFEVAGTSYHQKELEKVALKNKRYNLDTEQLKISYPDGQNIYKYDYTHKSALLIPEPSNPHDPNAIKIEIDGIHVGYVPAYLCNEIAPLIKKSLINSINAEIYGGEYKSLVLLASNNTDYIIKQANLNVIIKINN